jgi:hypothetical protein
VKLWHQSRSPIDSSEPLPSSFVYMIHQYDTLHSPGQFLNSALACIEHVPRTVENQLEFLNAYYYFYSACCDKQ